jgi:hypothetical protein
MVILIDVFRGLYKMCSLHTDAYANLYDILNDFASMDDADEDTPVIVKVRCVGKGAPKKPFDFKLQYGEIYCIDIEFLQEGAVAYSESICTGAVRTLGDFEYLMRG